MSQIYNIKYTYINILSFKTFDRSCFSMYQLYTLQFIDKPIQAGLSISQGVEVVMWP